MSDLSATNCGCGCEDSRDNCGERNGMSSCLWIIILLFCCGGCGNRFGNGFGNNDSCIWIILLLLFCGGCGNGFENRFENGCGCGC